MPDGRTHERTNLLLGASAFSLLAWQKALPPELLFAGAAGFTAGTFLVTPDMDQAGKGSSRALRRWGPLALLWLPYGLVFRHRGLSHLWPLGALTRLLYLLLLASPLLGPRPDWLFSPPALAFFAGFLLADLLHVLLDGMGSLRRVIAFFAAVLLLTSGAKAEGLEVFAGVEGSGRLGLRSGLLFPAYHAGLTLPVGGPWALEVSGPSPVMGVAVAVGAASPVVLSSARARLFVAGGYAFGASRPFLEVRLTSPAEGLGGYLAILGTVPLEADEKPFYVLRVGVSLSPTHSVKEERR
jgi:uncharacterized metal-binding protein